MQQPKNFNQQSKNFNLTLLPECEEKMKLAKAIWSERFTVNGEREEGFNLGFELGWKASMLRDFM